MYDISKILDKQDPSGKWKFSDYDLLRFELGLITVSNSIVCLSMWYLTQNKTTAETIENLLKEKGCAPQGVTTCDNVKDMRITALVIVLLDYFLKT